VSVPLFFLSSIYSVGQQPSCSNFKQITSANQDDAVPDETCNQFITNNRPRGDFRVPKTNIPLSRHHVIPLATFKDFYNIMIEILIDQRTDTREFRSIFVSILEHLMMHRLELWSHRSIEKAIESEDLEQVDVDLQRLANNEGVLFALAMRDNANFFSSRYQGAAGIALLKLSNELNYCTGVNNPGMCVMINAYLWMPWNIVIGPTKRTDDPGNKLDLPVLELLDRNQALRISSLNKRLTDFIRQPRDRTIENLRLIRDAFVYVIDNFIIPHVFNVADWRVTRTIGNITYYRALNRNERQQPINMRRKRQVGSFPNPCPSWATKSANIMRYLYDASVTDRLFFSHYVLEKTKKCASIGAANKTVRV